MKVETTIRSSPIKYASESINSVENLRSLIQISSESRDKKGVLDVQTKVQSWLEKIGFSVRYIEEASGKYAPLLIGETGSNFSRYINFVCHADTVFAKNSKAPDIRIEGNQIFGPGVIDNKGGILVALEGIRKFLKSNSQNVGLRFICSPNEEIGSPGFHPHFKTFGKDALVTLGFEPSAAGGKIITTRKGNLWYDISCFGQKAHAGRDHNKAANACAELAIKLSEAHRLTDYPRDVTVNIGKISGGEKHNVVSDVAFGQLDIRFPCHQTRTELKSKMEQLLTTPTQITPCKTWNSQIRYEIVDDCPPLSQTENSLELAKLYSQWALEVEGSSISSISVGGAADCNHFCINEHSVVLDGLGPRGGKMHTDEEFLESESLESRSEVLSHLLKQVNFQGGLQ